MWCNPTSSPCPNSNWATAKHLQHLNKPRIIPISLKGGYCSPVLKKGDKTLYLLLDSHMDAFISIFTKVDFWLGQYVGWKLIFIVICTILADSFIMLDGLIVNKNSWKHYLAHSKVYGCWLKKSRFWKELANYRSPFLLEPRCGMV